MASSSNTLPKDKNEAKTPPTDPVKESGALTKLVDSIREFGVDADDLSIIAFDTPASPFVKKLNELKESFKNKSWSAIPASDGPPPLKRSRI